MSSCEKEDHDCEPQRMEGSCNNKRPPSPTPTRVSMKSDQSMGRIITFTGEDSSTKQMEGSSSNKRPPSPTPTSVSMKSDQSMGRIITFKGENSSTGQMEGTSSNKRPPSPTPTRVSMKSDQSMDQIIQFTGGDSSTGQMEGTSSNKRPPSPTPTRVSMKSDQSMDQIIQFTGGDSSTGQFQQFHKSHLQKTFQCLFEGITQQGDTRLHEIYTDIYIIEGGRGEVNDEHEVRQIERASWREAEQGRPIKCSDIYDPLYGQPKRWVRYEHELTQIEMASCREAAQNTPIKCSDIFKPVSDKDKSLRTVLTKGVAGIGKTVSVQKFILDWAEEKANQDVHFIFPLPFRELNLMKEKKLSLMDLIQHFFPEIKDPRVFTSSEHRVMFIVDGLDECRLPLDFLSNPRCCDVTEPASVDVLLTNLIEGNLLPSALLWITTRPAAANQIPPECVDQVTEIRGFNNPQKEEYFRKKISDENLASRTITHLKSSRSLYIMCHIPIFCWISATVVEKTSKKSDKVEMPRTLTQMYTHFLVIQTGIKNVKYTERKETDEEVIFKLGKLAFQQLEKDNLIFYEEDLRECGIDITEASVYSGVCTQIFREESGLYQGKLFSFVHLSIQEFLAALYVFLCFSNRQRHMPDQHQTSKLSALFRAATLHDLHKTAVDLALHRENGHLDLFLRFLLGLSLESNQNRLKHLLPQRSSQSDNSEQTVQHVKQKIRDQKSPHKRINLFYCLNELNHHAVVVHKIPLETLNVHMLLPGQWKTKTFELKMTKAQLAEFDLQKYIQTPEEDQSELLSPDEVLQKVLPAVTSALLKQCGLSGDSFKEISSVLQSENSLLRDLDLTSNLLKDSGVKLLSAGLKHTNCRLEKLRLEDCGLSGDSCKEISSVLQSENSLLRELELSDNPLEDSGMELLSAGLKHTNCRLDTLRMYNCNLTDKSCPYLASALMTSHSSNLRLLDLSNNKLLDSGVELLCSALTHQNCKLEELWLYSCDLTDKSCSYLASALKSPSSNLRQLELINNYHISASAVEPLCALVKDEHCKLKKLKRSDQWDHPRRAL
ncbi:NACHT, LRR and PYD domains-containing protein 3-like isoform X2 [Alosa pseudoharengus]|uniref:NACHT, LRR and PYD domains-containing protein 3-like isoform X2 n=1 Tax=Alosa pseudoharengus TaxID=34774 RepID=UPI003F8A12A1